VSRVLKIMVALLATVAVAAPAFALTGDISGFLQVRGVAADNMDGRDKKGGMYDDNTRAVDQRLRLYTTAALNENVKAVFTVEVDYAWGDSGVGDLGADQKGEIEIANLYLDFNIPDANTNVKAGAHYFKMGGGLILGEHASGVSIRKAINEKLNLGLYWVKAVEGEKVTNKYYTIGADKKRVDDVGIGGLMPADIKYPEYQTTSYDGGGANDSFDVDYYQVQLDMKVGGMTISPFIGYLDEDDAGNIDEQYYYGLELKGKSDALDYSAVAFYNDGRVDGANNDAFAFLAKAGYTLGDTKLTAEVARYGDSDTADGQMVTVKGYNNFSEILTGGKFDSRTSAGGTNTSVLGSGNKAYYYNYQYAKLGAEQKLGDKSTLKVYYIYAQQAADTEMVGAKRLTFGHEIDAYYDYTVVPGLVMTVGGGYLLADDDYGITAGNMVDKTQGGDNAWKAGLGLAYKF
jgi:hypothetical protein